MKGSNWLLFAIITTIFWGVWGALIELPEKSGFPATLGYVVWALTMLPCSLVALRIVKWELDTDLRSILLGITVGLLGAGGQLLLFLALKQGPAYIVFPLISLFPVLTIILSVTVLKERASARQWIGIAVALAAIYLLAYQDSAGQLARGTGWLVSAILVFVLWGAQAFVMKLSNQTMKAESIFFYMMISGLLLIPFALIMTDFSKTINWGFRGPALAAIIQVLNSIGALMLVYALRFGRAIIVVPLTGLSPMITVLLSLLLYAVLPGTTMLVGIVLALAGIFLLSKD